jgi:hypothetical protein
MRYDLIPPEARIAYIESIEKTIARSRELRSHGRSFIDTRAMAGELCGACAYGTGLRPDNETRQELVAECDIVLEELRSQIMLSYELPESRMRLDAALIPLQMNRDLLR